MDKIEKYFKRKADKISFIEIKQNTSVKVGDYIVTGDLPLPVITDVFLKEIKKGNLQDDIKVSYIIEGIIFLMGTDHDFKYNDKYKEILKKYNSDIESYIFYKGLKEVENENYEKGAILFRTLTNLNREHINGLFNLGICYEGISYGEKELKEDFLKKSMETFESILDLNPKYSLAYYKLGYYYKTFGQFEKAKLSWEKFILLSKDSERKDEIREEIEKIADNASYERGCNLLFARNYSAAIDEFTHLENRYKDLWNIYYMKGLAYKGLNDLNSSIENFKKAAELNPKSSDIFNELGIALYGVGNFQDSIDAFSKGININDKDYRIICNRGIVYFQIGMYDEAKEDIDRAFSINPQNKTIKDVKYKLEKILGTN